MYDGRSFGVVQSHRGRCRGTLQGGLARRLCTNLLRGPGCPRLEDRGLRSAAKVGVVAQDGHGGELEPIAVKARTTGLSDV